MQMIGVTTRTLPPTDREPKRVGIKTSEGMTVTAPWDHEYDAPEVHERAAINAVRTMHPDAEIRAVRTESNATGYGFHVHVTEATT